jgi:hypothetical protein
MIKIRLQRFDRVRVGAGFYAGYGGVVLDKRCFLWYAINIGGEPKYLPRWNLRFIGYKKPELHKKIRERMIANDRKTKLSVS